MDHHRVLLLMDININDQCDEQRMAGHLLLILVLVYVLRWVLISIDSITFSIVLIRHEYVLRCVSFILMCFMIRQMMV
jgi:hypothetical protein